MGSPLSNLADALRAARIASGGVALAAIVVAGFAASCGGGRDLASHGDDTGGGFILDDTALEADGPIGIDEGAPYAVLGVQPSHGPFNGGTRVEIRGRGFSSKTKVRFGATDVPAGDVTARDTEHVQVITPAGEPGEVDVQVRDEITGDKSLLKEAFTYDAFYAKPNSGATGGGTLVALIGRGTTWAAGTTATIDGKGCTDLVVDDATHMHCVAPAGTPGTKSISVTTPDLVVSTARDAYTYSDAPDGYRGGLAGDKLPGELRVVAFINPTGDFLPDVTVVARGADGTSQTKTTDVGGTASFPAPPPAPLTVTLTKKCIKPVTFDGVNVRSLTVFLNGIMKPGCGEGEPKPKPTTPIVTGTVIGELVWPDGIEFKRAAWKGIPDPKTKTQRAVAYVFVAGRDNLAKFELPDPSTATLETSPGTIGYRYKIVVPPGNVTLYAIAGIEDRPASGPATLDPYVYGITRGVAVPGGGVIDNVLIKMAGNFTHEVTLIPDSPPTTPKGPDRLISSFAIDVGGNYMLLPYPKRQLLLPLSGSIRYAGVPPLSGALDTSWYVVGAEDVNAFPTSPPLSSILRFKTRNSSSPVSVTPFMPLAKVTSPVQSAPWDGRTVKIELPDGSADVILMSISSGASEWTIIAPGKARTLTLPDFGTSPDLGLPGGYLGIGIIAARLDPSFSYDSVRYAHLNIPEWNAYSFNAFYGFW